MSAEEKMALTMAKKKIKKLEEENKKLKQYQTMIYCVWSDLYWADKAGCEVSFKDVSRSCDYYENEEFVKKEVVEDGIYGNCEKCGITLTEDDHYSGEGKCESCCEEE
jgi:hypothetical protein